MGKLKTVSLAVVFLLISISVSTSADEFRAFWADSWHSGFESSAATQNLVNYLDSCNANAVILEVRKRADSYYNSPTEPKGTSVDVASGYDPLADAITKCHSAGIELHAWAVTYRVWEGKSGPSHSTPEHLWYLHPEWFMLDSSGNQFFSATTNLDPGVPAVEDYLVNTFLYIVKNYDIDGFTLDYIRYPGLDWGYNATSVARFNAEYGRTGNPSSTDIQWENWRRDQISNLVKRVYLEIKAVKPKVKVGAAVWKTADSGNSGYLQDWDRWMSNHWLDYVCPMNYTTTNSTFHSNNVDNLARQYGHHVYVAPGSYLNTAANNVTQMQDLQSLCAPGMALYSYAVPNLSSDQSTACSTITAGPWASKVSVPAMSWLTSPTKGYIKGYVRDADGNAIYPAYVTISSLGSSDKDSGTGFYGFSEVAPGTYTLSASSAGYIAQAKSVTVTAGKVASIDFALTADTKCPTIGNVNAGSVQATNALITWTTDKESTSQVDYGTSTSYGTTTTEDVNRVTSHSVQLTGLTPNATYHFRVRSYDVLRNVGISGDFTFKTAAYDSVSDIIIDNTDSGFSTSGSWTVGTSSSDKYGASYDWASTTTSTSVYATWCPNIIVSGTYDVYCWYPQGTNRTAQGIFDIFYNDGSSRAILSEQSNGGKWIKLVSAREFDIGSGGYVRTYANTGETGRVVMADAVKFVYVDIAPPSVPANLNASAYSTTQIALSWAPSTDNTHLSGYQIFRNGVQVGITTSNSYIDTGLSANTSYMYSIKAYDASGNVSSASSSVTRYTLSTAPTVSSLACSEPVNEWKNIKDYTFTASSGFGAGNVQYYRYFWDRNSTYTFTGVEKSWNSGSLTVSSTLSGQWYLHIAGYNANNIVNGTYTYGPYNSDTSEPSIDTISTDAYTDENGQLSAEWSGSDDESGIVEYQYAIGSSADNIESVLSWTSSGLSTSVTTSGLSLVCGRAYYFGVKAKNGAGVWSDVAVSNKIVAAKAVSKISDAKALEDGIPLIMMDKAVTARFDGSFYIEEIDRTSGIKIDSPLEEGIMSVDLGGVIQTINGERVLTSANIKPCSTQ